MSQTCAHVWRNTSSHGTPVLGISTCRMCRIVATASDIERYRSDADLREARRLTQSMERLRAFSDRPAFDPAEVREAFAEEGAA